MLPCPNPGQLAEVGVVRHEYQQFLRGEERMRKAGLTGHATTSELGCGDVKGFAIYNKLEVYKNCWI